MRPLPLLLVLACCWSSFTSRTVHGEHYNIVNNGNEFTMQCLESQTLDNAAKPRYPEPNPVGAVTLRNCPPPKSSYAHALRMHNVTMYRNFTIEKASEEITAAHLSGLKLTSLVLTNLRIAPNTFDAFDRSSDLFRLRLKSVTPVLAERLPASLRYLHLRNTEVKDLTSVQLQRFPNLTELIIENDDGNISVETTAPLRTVSLSAPFVRVHPVLADTLESLTVIGWAEPVPRPWETCKQLKRLYVKGGTITKLPNNWLASCDNLALLTLTKCGLVTLPGRLLYRTSSLSHIDLSANDLKELPPGWFVNTNKIRKVDLSRNKLEKEVFKRLRTLLSVQELILAHNVALGDACSGSDRDHETNLSDLSNLIELQKLDLSNTSATVICRDFRDELLHLRELNLRHNDITTLTFKNTESKTKMKVYLEGNNVTRLSYDWEEYRSVAITHRDKYCNSSSEYASQAEFELTSALSCDCHVVPAALALRACPGHRHVSSLRCSSGRALSAVPLDELVCALPAGECPAPAPCRCAWRQRLPPAPNATVQGVLRVTCAALPAPAPSLALRTANATQLILANTSIAALARSDLPTNLLDLDLRNTTMKRLEPSIVELLPADGRLWLSNNPLSCDCDDEAAMAALIARSALVQDIEKLRCPDGGQLRMPDCSVSPGTLAGALAAPFALVVLLLGCLVRRKVRVHLKMVLRGLGWLPPRAETNDDERPYDAFVSFSHLDSGVVRELLERLEGGPRPYRVCVHYRDWAPGGWIPAQIAASVRRSRRTLAVVSAHFLGSAWARAEFREAHAAALRDPEPRLVVVLLDEPARLPLDDELRRYLAANTYVRWGDPWFWHKLRAALPPPRGHTARPAPRSTDPAGLADPADAAASDLASADAEQQPLMLQLLSPPNVILEKAAA